MLRKAVDSSNLNSVGYDPSSQTLEIEFQSGEVYQYFSFPPNMYEAFMSASSMGRFFATMIKDKFRFVKIT